jgi:hypothetical protein
VSTPERQRRLRLTVNSGLASRDESEASVRAEYYQQTFDERMAVPASLQGIDLYPGLKAILVKVGWRF